VFLGCAAGGPPPSVPGSSSTAPVSEPEDVNPEGQDVLAFIEKLEWKAHEEFLSDGGVIASNVVSFAIVEPEGVRWLLVAHTPELPRIGDRRIQLGDFVRFVMPRDWRNRDLELSDLEKLRFRD
jgi:hypothetical protein